MKNFIRISTIIMLVIGVVPGLFAQIPNPQAAPIDGGITALAVAASAYIGKKLYDRKK